MKRRAFLEIGAGLSLAAALPSLAWSRPAPPPAAASRTPTLLLVDARGARGQARLADATRNGIPAAAVEDDVTGFFYEQLHGRWPTEVPLLAGLTGYAPYFCLSQMARDQDMRVLLQEQFDATDHEHALYAWIAFPRAGASHGRAFNFSV